MCVSRGWQSVPRTLELILNLPDCTFSEQSADTLYIVKAYDMLCFNRALYAVIACVRDRYQDNASPLCRFSPLMTRFESATWSCCRRKVSKSFDWSIIKHSKKFRLGAVHSRDAYVLRAERS